RPELDKLASGATGPAETYPAIRQALSALGDGHSHLALPSHVDRLSSPPANISGHGITAKMLGRVGYVGVPAFASTNSARGEQFAQPLRGHLDRQAAAAACGWIVDLRDNTGGNMYPMSQGLSGLLRGDTLGYFVGLNDRSPWSARRAGPED